MSMGWVMKIFISGGCKNGKSTYAQKFAAKQNDKTSGLYYIATMTPKDSEDIERVRRHQAEREGWGFDTIEMPKYILGCLPLINPGASVLLDSATALFANEMFTGDRVDHSAAQRVADDLKTLVNSLENIVIVSDAIYSDAFLYDSLTEDYRRGLALIDRTLARHCDVVLEASFGTLTVHKGTLPSEEL